jgi:hypothetical protein
MTESSYIELQPEGAGRGAGTKAWVKGVPFDPGALRQLRNTA